MLIKRPDDIRPSEITDQTQYINRRQFIRASGLVGAGLLATCGVASMTGAACSSAAGGGFNAAVISCSGMTTSISGNSV